MRFIIDADLPRQSASLVRTYGHEARDVRDIGMTSAIDSAIATYAQQTDSCIITGDF